MKRLFVYTPVVLLVLLVGVDRLATLPDVLRLGRGEPTWAESLRAIVPVVTKQLNNTRDESGEGARSVLFIGSSRSIAFSTVNAEIWRRDSRLNAGEKAILERYHGSAKLSIPLQDAINVLGVADTIAAHPEKVDAVVLEVSPYLLYNTLLAETRWYENISETRFLWNHNDVFPGTLRSDGLARLLFRTYNYKFKPERALKNLISGDASRTAEDVASFFAFQSLGRASFATKGHSFSGTRPTAAEVKYMRAELGNAFTDGLYRGIDREMALVPAFKRTAQTLEQSGVKLILWLPPLHRVMVDLVYRKLNQDGRYMARYYEQIRETGLPFYNGYLVRERCDVWNDVSHISSACYPLMSATILDCLESPDQTHCQVGQNPYDPLAGPQKYFD